MPHFITRLPWWAALTLIGGSAAGITAWSLYFVAHHMYGVPKELAVLTAAVFDGTAIACLYLANQAVKEQRSALGPEAAAVGQAAVSVYLNARHASRIHGGLGATLLFAVPTIALMLLCGLAWSGTRARLRAAGGERPVALPRYGAWGWLLAWDQAKESVKNRAIAHVTSTDTVRTGSGPRPGKPRGAAEFLRQQFAEMDPAAAIRLAAEAKPGATVAEVAEELAVYGVHVTPVAVALVLGQQPPGPRIERPNPSGPPPGQPLPTAPSPALTSPDANPDPPGPRPTTIIEAVKQIADLGVTDPALVTNEVALLMNKPVKEETVRRYLDKLPKPQDGVGKGGGGYA